VGSGGARALHLGLGILWAWPGGCAWGLDFRLSQKTRSARAFGLCSERPSPHVGPGPDPALVKSDNHEV
jgi:hypothetical protein